MFRVSGFRFQSGFEILRFRVQKFRCVGLGLGLGFGVWDENGFR